MKKLILMVVVLGVVVTLAGCGTGMGTGTSESHHSSSTSTITVTNNSGFAVNVYMDGGFKLSLYRGEAGTITDVSNGNHSLEAYRQQYGHFIAATSGNCTGGNYTWVIPGPTEGVY